MKIFLKTIRRIFFHQSNHLTNHYLCACICRWKITATFHSEKSILRIKISSKPKKKKKRILAKVIRESFTTLQMDWRSGRRNVSTLTPNHSREFYSQVSRFLHSKVKLSRITLQSSILTLIRKSKISIPILQSFILKKTSILAPKIIQLQRSINFSDLRSSRALSYLILSYLNATSSIARNKRNVANARVRSFFPKIVPLFDGATRFLP